MGDRFEPWTVSGKTRHRAWMRVNAKPWQNHRVYLGQLPDGRWYANTTDEPYAWAYPDEDSALAHAREMMAEGDWRPVDD